MVKLVDRGVRIRDAVQYSGKLGLNGWWRAQCPFCEEVLGTSGGSDSFGVEMHTGRFICFRCESKGALREHEFFPELGEYHDDDSDWRDRPNKPRQEHVIEPPEEYEPLAGDESFVLAGARDYLYDRGVPEEVVDAAGIGAALDGRLAGRIIVPLRHADRTWYGYSARAFFDGVFPKYLYPPEMPRLLYEGHLLQVETDEPAILVEGVFDALPYWGRAVATLGKPNDEHFRALVTAKRPVVVCFDGDAWTLAKMTAMRLRLRGIRSGYVRLPPKQDPGSVDPDWLCEQVARAIT